MTGAGRAPDPEVWEPLLAGEAAREALNAARAVASRMAPAVGPEEEPARTRGGREGPPRDAGLGEGAAGFALALAYLSVPLLGRSGSSASLSADGLVWDASPGSDPSLFGGFAGVGWVVAHLGRRSGRTPRRALTDVDEAVRAVVSRSPWDGGVDLISGLTGLGLYALERLPGPSAVSVLEFVVERLAEAAEPRDGGFTWWTSPDLLPPARRAEFPDGHFNLGLAHGVPGVVAFLGRVVAAGVAVDAALGLLSGAVTWLLRQRKKGPRGDFAKWTGPGLQPVFRDAWCYGDPGVAAALFLAGRSTGNTSWEREAITLAAGAAARGPLASGVVSVDLCHGAAGLGHLFNRLWQASRDDRLREAAAFWVGEAVRRLKEGEAADDLGFLQGSGGVALALLSAATGAEPEWDRVLLLSGARPGGRP